MHAGPQVIPRVAEPVSLKEHCHPQAAMGPPGGQEVASRPPRALLVHIQGEDLALVQGLAGSSGSRVRTFGVAGPGPEPVEVVSGSDLHTCLVAASR